LTIIKDRMKKSRRAKQPPVHPGEILREDFMKPLSLSQNRLAMDLRVPLTRIADIVHERRTITADTALRLGRYFDTSPRFWLNLQAAYDLDLVQDKIGPVILREVRQRSA
jgi:antitoxin HigA-1